MNSEKIILPHPALAGLVKYYWVLEADNISHIEPVIPTGDIQLLFHYRTPFQHLRTDGRIEQQPRCSISGQLTLMRQIQAFPVCGTVSAVLYPFAPRFFFDIPLDQLTDITLPLEELDPEGNEVAGRIIDYASTRDRIRLIEEFLLRSYQRLYERRSSTQNYHLHLLKVLVRQIEVTHGLIDIASLTAEHAISERQLERIFKAGIGVSPKLFGEIIQVNHAISCLKANRTTTAAILDAGFYDQSHSIRMFKKFTGLTPSQFRALACMSSQTDRPGRT